MPSRAKTAPKKKPAKSVATKKAAPATKSASKPAPAKKPPVAAAATANVARTAGPAVSMPPPRPGAGAAPPAAKPAARPISVGQAATAQQAEERRKAATRKLFARIRSIEAILGADLRKRGSLLLSQAVDQWYAEATSATATDVSITNAARAVISQL
jgi:hypothetical protein